MKTGRLFIVATPIGNPRDITMRAVDVLGEVDAIICEERRAGTTLLKKIGVLPKEIILLNEHNETAQVTEIITRLCKGQDLALISDCGTPVFSDPGHMLINQVAQATIPVIPIPGVSSLSAALSILDFKLEKFIYAGFLSRDAQVRRTELQKLRGMRLPVILMDTPYRLAILLEDVERIFGKEHRATLACDLTLPAESIYRDHIGAIRRMIGQRKAEFILILHGKSSI